MEMTGVMGAVGVIRVMGVMKVMGVTGTMGDMGVMTDNSRALLVAPVRWRGMGAQDPIEAAEHALPFRFRPVFASNHPHTNSTKALATPANTHSTKNRIATLTHSDTCKLRRITIARSSCLHAYYSTRETSMPFTCTNLSPPLPTGNLG